MVPKYGFRGTNGQAGGPDIASLLQDLANGGMTRVSGDRTLYDKRTSVEGLGSSAIH